MHGPLQARGLAKRGIRPIRNTKGERVPHLLVSSNSDPVIPVIWNVDAPVGKGGANNSGDVYLVQYLMYKIGLANKIPGQAALCAVLKKIRITGSCDQPTIDGIEAYQLAARSKNPGNVVDRKISRATSSYNYGSGSFLICQINYDYKCANWNHWPCLELDQPPPPDAVRSMVFKSLYGNEPIYS